MGSVIAWLLAVVGSWAVGEGPFVRITEAVSTGAGYGGGRMVRTSSLAPHFGRESCALAGAVVKILCLLFFVVTFLNSG